MTVEEVNANLIQHGACENAFLAWGPLTSDEIWSFPARKSPVADSIEILGLFWWVAKNADVPGWATLDEVKRALATILSAAEKYLTSYVDLLRSELLENPNPPAFVARLEHLILQENVDPAARDSWCIEILPTIKGLEHP